LVASAMKSAYRERARLEDRLHGAEEGTGTCGVAWVGHRLDRAMPDPAAKPDEIDEAIARAWRPRTVEELMAGVPVLQSWDQLAIPDLTDEEWEAFEVAMKDV